MDKLSNLYIPDWLPIASAPSHTRKVMQALQPLHIFEWTIVEEDECNQVQIQTFMKMESLCQQIRSFFQQHPDQEFNVIVDSFSQLVFFQVYEEIKHQVRKLILVNPFDKSIYCRLMNMKSKLLPVSQVEVVNKYIYLCQSLNHFRENPVWLESIRQEVQLFDKNDLLYHKLFDQFFTLKLLRHYFKWLSNAKYNFVGILSQANPLLICHPKNYRFTTKIIPESGYCLLWEAPEAFITLIKSLI